MRLKLTNFSSKGQVAALNRWADSIHQDIAATNVLVSTANTTANAALAQVPPASTLSDGLIHGDKIWSVDSGAVRLYDDFTQFNAAATAFTSNFISALPWNSIPATGQFQWTGAPPYLGQVGYNNSSSAYTGSGAVTSFLYPLIGSTGTNGTAVLMGFPLAENPSWKLVWNFAIGRNYNQVNTGATLPVAFSWAQVSFYIGLGNTSPQSGALTTGNNARPNNFIGLRYDTDPGTTYTLSAAGNASSGNTTYTGTITGGASSAYAGMTFTVSGFLTAANNGTFVCVASTATTLILANVSGAAESHAATAVELGTADAQFVFECVSNRNWSAQRNSAQGNTFATGITVTEGRNYRFEVICTTAGSVTMNLTDGVTAVTSTLVVPTVSFPAPAATLANQTLPGFIKNGIGIISNGGTPIMPFISGSKIASSGWSVALSTFNSSALILSGQGTGGQINFLSAAADTGPTSQAATVTGYPALGPWMGFGNDSRSSPTASSKTVFIDAFEFVWNPGVAGLTSATPTTLKARYF